MTTKLKVRDTDAALIFRRDGVVEKLTPLDGENAPNEFITEALFWASMSPAMMKTITSAFVDSLEREPLRH
jgi:hypothetical protein